MKRICFWLLVILIGCMPTIAWAKVVEKSDSFYGTKTVSSIFLRSTFFPDNNYGTTQRKFVLTKSIASTNEPENVELSLLVIYKTVQPFMYNEKADLKIGTEIFVLPLKKNETIHGANASADDRDMIVGFADHMTDILKGIYTVPPEAVQAIKDAAPGTKVTLRSEWSFSGDKNIDLFNVPDKVLQEWKQVLSIN